MDALGVISKLNDLHGPIVQLLTSAMKAQKAVESLRVMDSIQLRILAPVGEVELPPKQQKTNRTPPPITSKAENALSEKMDELIMLARQIADRIAPAATEKIKISLVGKRVWFDDAKSTIFINTTACPLPPAKSEDYLARAMFNRPVAEPVDWSIIHQEMTGNSEVIGSKIDQKSLRDTMGRLNERIKEVVCTDDRLLSWKNKSICRNF
jgi:hypothetical protein